MIIKSIKLSNFRQFRDETIFFAEGEDGKNVTLMIGDNGSGKTTFEQAFLWCLYGETGFKDTILLNRDVSKGMYRGGRETTSVELNLTHGDANYLIQRSQAYTLDGIGKIQKAKDSNLVVKIKKAGDETYQTLTTYESELEIRNILPKELSQYFFFQGEEMEAIADNISPSKKSVDFSDAVNGLLGLNAISMAIQHFEGSQGVVKQFEHEFDKYEQDNQNLKKYNDDIKNLDKKIEQLDQEIPELEKQIEDIDQQIRDKEDELRTFQEGKALLDKQADLEKSIRDKEKIKSEKFKNICNRFNVNVSSFLSASMMKRSLEIVNAQDFDAHDIPHLHRETLEFLLSREECLCGNELKEGNAAYEAIKKWINEIPEESMNTRIAEFKRIASMRAKNLDEDLQRQLQDDFDGINELNDDIEAQQDEIFSLEQRIKNKDAKEQITIITKDKQALENKKSHLIHQQGEKDNEKKRAVTERSRLDAARGNLSLAEGTIARIEICKEYAQRILDDFQAQYKQEESETREELQEKMNELFQRIYNGGLELTIDENYHIQVTVKDDDVLTEASTAQRTSIMFAFISSIIKMARERRDNGTFGEDTSTEPYPLVMDAPLSAFDKRRIQAICEVIPENAEQVIIFIKDTDGDIAKEHLQEKIGKFFHFEKKSETETVIVESEIV